MKSTPNFKITMNDSNELILNRQFTQNERSNIGYYKPCDMFGRIAFKKTVSNKPVIVTDEKEARKIAKTILKAERLRRNYKEVLFTIKL